MKLLFVPSEFRAQLPRPFDPRPNGTWTIPPYMNDLNKEESTRYVNIPSTYLWAMNVLRGYYLLFAYLKATLKDCHYLVDLETGQVTEREPQYSQMISEWEVIFQVDFLDTAR